MTRALRSVAHLLLLVGVLSLSGCIQFTNSIVDHPLPNDPRLFGVWEKAGDKNGGFLAVGPKSAAELLISSEGKGSSCEKKETYTAVRTRLGGRDFMEVSGIDGIASNAKATRLWVPLAYALGKGNRLAIYTPDPKSIRRAVTSGVLPGETHFEKVGKQRYLAGTITATTGQLRQYFATHPRVMRVMLTLTARPDLHQLPPCTGKSP